LFACDHRAPTVSPGRRALLVAVGRAGQVAAAMHAAGSGAALLALGGALPPRARATPAQELLAQPAEIRSRNGVLEATLTAAAQPVQVGEYSFPGSVYNGAYLPPLLRPRLGDVMRIKFRNSLPDDPSNLHYHGLSVSPKGSGDNVFVHVHPGEQFDYEVRIPAAGRQGPGLFWYHPHAHGVVAKQMLGGMSGGLVVEGMDRLYPMLRGLPERFFLIKHAQVGRPDDIISVNGQVNPVVQIRPGAMQFWRVANIGATLFLKVRVEGMPLYVVATDGHPLSRPRRMTEFFVGPGQRIDAIAVGPKPGEYAMATIPFRNEAWKEPDPSQRLATVVSSGTALSSADLEDRILRQRLEGVRWIDEVRSAFIARRRAFDYTKTPDRHAFMINGRVMHENRVDETVRLGDTEEWTVINRDQQYHSFHIHQTAFLVTEVNDDRPDEDSLRDTFPVPPATEQGPGVLKVLIPFTDPVMVGRFVFHCHAVDHEDKGMMGVVEVVG
jgi:FtsP/CotA-like multicopper oxidase with cupredoxin domain